MGRNNPMKSAISRRRKRPVRLMPALSGLFAMLGSASGADGRQLAAVANDGPICIVPLPLPPSRPLLSPRLEIRPSGGTLELSWLVPSASLGLERNPELAQTSWSDIQTPPAFNSTNLHYEISEPLTNGQSFFRLSPR